MYMYICASFSHAVCRMVVHRMCMVEGIMSCDIWKKRTAGEERKSLYRVLNQLLKQIHVARVCPLPSFQHQNIYL